MKWLSIDTDIFEDGKVKILIRKCGVEGYGVYQYLLTKTAKKVDLDNSRNGYYELDDGDDPVEALAWELHLDKEKVKEVLQQLAELELIDPESYEDGKIYLPKLLERKHTKSFLSKQEGGRKGGKRKGEGEDKDSERTPSSTPNNNPSTDKDKDKDKDKETTTTNSVESCSTPSPEKNKGNGSEPVEVEPEFGEDTEVYQLTKGLRDRIVNWYDPVPRNVPDTDNPSNTDMQKWCKEMDRLLRLGTVGGENNGLEPKAVKYLFHWIYDIDDFWRDTIQSPHGLRKNLSRIATNAKSYRQKQEGKNKFGGQSEGEYLDQLVEEM